MGMRPPPLSGGEERQRVGERGGARTVSRHEHAEAGAPARDVRHHQGVEAFRGSGERSAPASPMTGFLSGGGDRSFRSRSRRPAGRRRGPGRKPATGPSGRRRTPPEREAIPGSRRRCRGPAARGAPRTGQSLSEVIDAAWRSANGPRIRSASRNPRRPARYLILLTFTASIEAADIGRAVAVGAEGIA